MRAQTLPLMILALAILAVQPVQAQEAELRSGYVVCKAGGQLAFFMEPTVGDLFGGGAPDSVRVYPHGHPRKTASMMVGGRFQTVTKGRKALENGDCRKTTEWEGESVTILAKCTDVLPLPNGGCRQVRIKESDWFTFGNAISGP